MSAWKAFVQRVRAELPGCGFWDATLLFLQPCYSLRVQLPETVHDQDRSDEVVCLLTNLTKHGWPNSSKRLSALRVCRKRCSPSSFQS
jgi:hypothetical protein